MRYTMACLFVIGLIAAPLSMGGCASTDLRVSFDAQSFRAKKIAVVSISEGEDPTIWDGLTITWDASRSQEITESIERALATSTLYSLENSMALEQAIAKENLEKTALTDPETAARVAKLAGLDGIVLVRPVGYTKTVLLLFYYVSKTTEVRMINAETAAEVWSADVGFTDMGFFPIMPATMVFTSAETRMAKDLKYELRDRVLSGGSLPPPPNDPGM